MYQNDFFNLLNATWFTAHWLCTTHKSQQNTLNKGALLAFEKISVAYSSFLYCWIILYSAFCFSSSGKNSNN